jgi:hypothetical protein
MTVVDQAAALIQASAWRTGTLGIAAATNLADSGLLVTDEIQAVLIWAQRQVETHPQYAMAGFAAAVDAYLASRQP